MHALMLVLLPAVDSLRSYLAKSACMLLMEMLHTFQHKLDAELEYVVPVLVKKAGEASFLSAEADHVLARIVQCCTDTRVMTALLNSAQHKNAASRARVSFHLDAGLQRGERRMFVGAAGRDILERLFR